MDTAFTSGSFCNGGVNNQNSPLDKRTKHCWTKIEDEMLINAISRYGLKNWEIVAQKVPGRSVRQCRERWFNNLNPHRKNKHWTFEEDILLNDLKNQLGKKWATIARYFPNRTANDIKNRWYTYHSKSNRDHMGQPIIFHSANTSVDQQTNLNKSQSFFNFFDLSFIGGDADLLKINDSNISDSNMLEFINFQQEQ